MKPLGEAVGRVVQMRSPRPAAVPAKPGTMLPEIPPELARDADLLGGNLRFGDMVLSQPNPRFHPDAERHAAEIRVALAPAPIEFVRAWFTDVVKRLGPGPVPAQAVFEGLADVSEEMPALCWSPVTRREVTRNYTFLPSAAELCEKVLDPEARKWRGRATGFERMAKATREPETDWRDRQAPTGMSAPAAEETPQRKPLRERRDADDIDRDDAAEQDREARDRARAQFAALGLTSADAAAQLQAKNAERRGAK